MRGYCANEKRRGRETENERDRERESDGGRERNREKRSERDGTEMVDLMKSCREN